MSNNNDDVWDEAKEGVKPIKVNRYVEDKKPQEIEIRKNKVTTVTFDMLKGGKSIVKDDFTNMDGNLAKRFKREEYRVEATLDLHGITEKDAFVKVCDFIKLAYNNRKRIVLIITGKGFDDTLFSGKGVLKKAVPNWLATSEISPLILAYKNPSESLGGKGSLYIMLRKK